MSDDVDNKEGKNVAEVKPVYLSESKKILPIVKNLQAVYRTNPESINWEADVQSRSDKLARLGVHQSWFGDEELTGVIHIVTSDGGSKEFRVTPWIEILDEAEVSDDPNRRNHAARFVEEADLARPVEDPKNNRFLLSMSTQPQIEARGEVERARREQAQQDELERIRKIADERYAQRRQAERIRREEEDRKRQLQSEAEKLRIAEQIKNSREEGHREGLRLAGRVYDPEKRREIEDTLDLVVASNRKGISKIPEDVIRRSILGEIDSYGSGGFLDAVEGKNYMKEYAERFRKENGRKPRKNEIETEIMRTAGIQSDLKLIRKYEARDTVEVPLDVDREDYALFSVYRERSQLKADALKLRNDNSSAYRDGFTEGYDAIRAGRPFTDENRPWFIPEHNSSK